MQADSKGRLFVNGGKETAVITRKPDGTWDVDKRLFSRLGTTLISSVFPESDGVAWLQFYDGRMVRFDTAQDQGTQKTLSTLVRGVQTTRGQPVFGGAGAAANAKVLEPDFNSLRIEFSAPSFLGERATEYQSRLDGLDDDWSPWTRETRRDYTNLGFGDYRFRVRARNVTGQVSDEAVYAFTILPPWYRTWWAYGGYLLLAALLVFAVDHALQRRRVVTHKERERAQFAEARLRAEAAEALARSESEGKKQRRAAQRDRPRDHRLARLRHDLRQLYERVNRARRRRRVRRRPLSPGPPGDRVPPRDREGQALRAVHARHDATPTSFRSGASSTASRSSSTTSRPNTAATSARYEDQARRSKTARCRGAAVDHLPAAHRQGSRARHHHHPELREERVHRASPERDAEPGGLRGHRARQRRRLPAAERAGARDPPPLRRSAARAGDRRRSRRRQERVPLDGQSRAAHAAHLGARLRQDHQEAARGSHLPAGSDRRPQGACRRCSRSKTT